MSDERLIRIENLRRVCAERHLGAKELASNYYGRYTYWRDLLEGGKSFGEKAARKVEAALGLPDKWLDTPHQPDKATGASPPPVPTKAVPDHRWRAAADLLAKHCDRLDIAIAPATFLLLVDAAVDSIKDHDEEGSVAEVFNRLWPLVQRGVKQPQA
jgi:hypothetical protein